MAGLVSGPKFNCTALGRYKKGVFKDKSKNLEQLWASVCEVSWCRSLVDSMLRLCTAVIGNKSFSNKCYGVSNKMR